MTLKETAGALGVGAVLTASVALATLSEDGAPCYRQSVQIPAEDYGGVKGELVTVDVERVLASPDDPLPAGWEAVTKPEPIDCKDAEAADKALAWAPPEKRGFPAVIPEREGLDGKTQPARSVVCPPPPWVDGHEPEGCAAEWGRLQRAAPVVEVVP